VSGPLTGVTVSREGVVTGNTFDKYGSSNPVVRRLMRAFERELEELLRHADPQSLLDVGCGEGVLAQRFAQLLGGGRVVGVDLEEPSLQRGWQQHAAPNLTFMIARAEALPFASGEFDLVSAIEVLEHLPHPERALGEMARCAGGHLLVSVPREPLWRALNVARGAYLGALGNTPGHLNHWSARSFVNLLSRYGEVRAVRKPLPWTLALVRL
jgi:2-polyprenyl-3-methyl-5-hydroxy-6-metoxy-1,4-benzoquinol methylase